MQAVFTHRYAALRAVLALGVVAFVAAMIALAGLGDDNASADLVLPGDVDCNSGVDSIDAALILQLNVGRVSGLPCQDNGDTNADGAIDAVDAALVLQLDGGLINSLPGASKTPTPLPTGTLTVTGTPPGTTTLAPPATPTPCPPEGCPTPTTGPTLPPTPTFGPTPTTGPLPDASMVLNVKSGGACDDPVEPTECTVMVGSKFTLSVDILLAPDTGYIGVGTQIAFGTLTYNPTATEGDEIVVSGCGSGFELRRIDEEEMVVNHAMSTALLPPFPICSYEGNAVEISLTCPVSSSPHAVELRPYSAMNTLGSGFMLSDGRTILPAGADPLVINCVS